MFFAIPQLFSDRNLYRWVATSKNYIQKTIVLFTFSSLQLDQTIWELKWEVALIESCLPPEVSQFDGK